MILVFLLGICSMSQAQRYFQSNKRTKYIKTFTDLQFDTLSIVPHTILLDNVDSSFYTIDYATAKLHWKKKVNTDSVKISYRVFPTRLDSKMQLFDYTSIANNNYLIPHTDRLHLNPSATDNTDIFNFGKIQYSGSFGRSISVGNSQDATFNSQFNLQMNGYIGDSIHLAAALSDNNIAIQPDGTTQSLNEFDQILVQFEKKNWKVNIGDIDLRRNQNYYLSFYKRLQGINYVQKWTAGKNISGETSFAGAVARGQYARNVLTLTNGNQGPYKLTGNNNETNLIVLAGTERVYLNGTQLQRGEDQDYIIDYNTAQITFTQKHLISTDYRIQVEFEYAEKYYLNSMFYVDNITRFGKKFDLRFAAYQNSDAKNSPISQDLDRDQKQFLADLGDSIHSAVYNNITADTFSSTKVMYAKIDTVVNSVHDSIYVYSTNADSAKYYLSFINVGANKGNYVLVSSSNVNGKVFQWVAPIDGVMQGYYQPGEFLVTPKKKQIFTMGADYNLSDKDKMSFDYALSKYDINTYSSKDKTNDNGNAGRFQYQHTENITTGKNQKKWVTAAGYEWNSTNFQTVERLRAVEFSRDWGLSILTDTSSEKITTLKTGVYGNDGSTLEYSLGRYQRGDNYSAIRNILTHQQRTPSGWSFNETVSFTNMRTPTNKGAYWKPIITITKALRGAHPYTVGAGYLEESNIWHNNITDTITPLSYHFRTMTAFINSDQSKPNNWGFSYYNRKDWIIDSIRMQPYTVSNNFNFFGQLFSNPNRQFKYNLTYRQFKYNNTSDTATQLAEKTLLGRIEYNFNEWNGALNGNVLYEIGSGQELKLSYVYVQVTRGLGQYTWNDYNGDGIAQLSEFEIATYADQANYIRVYASSATYIKANYTQFNYSVNFNPRLLYSNIAEEKWNHWQKFITKYTVTSTLQTSKKIIGGNTPELNPFQGSIADTSLLSLSYIMSNVVTFNRNNPHWGLEFAQLMNYNKALLTYGQESNTVRTYNFKSRLNISRILTFEYKQLWGEHVLLSSGYTNRNYSYSVLTASPTLTYIKNSRFRVALNYDFTQKVNAIDYGGQKAVSSAISLSSKMNFKSTSIFSGKFVFQNLKFNGDDNTTAGYNMLEGLSSGRNLQWTGSVTQRFFKNLEFNFEYTGRKSGTIRTIHRGTATIRAIL